jgi:hypothetical protein
MALAASRGQTRAGAQGGRGRARTAAAHVSHRLAHGIPLRSARGYRVAMRRAAQRQRWREDLVHPADASRPADAPRTHQMHFFDKIFLMTFYRPAQIDKARH